MRQRPNLIILFGIAFSLIGGLIVFLVLRDNDDDTPAARANSDGTTAAQDVTILVAAADIPVNTTGPQARDDGLIGTKTVPAGTQPAGALTDPSVLDNRIFSSAVAEGDPITSAALIVRSSANITIPPGFEGLTLTVDYTRGGAGYLAPGDRVNLYGVFGPEPGTAAGVNPNSAPLPRTELLLTNVLVLDVSEQAVSSTGAAAAAGTTGAVRPVSDRPITFLLAMKPTDIERIVLMDSFGDIQLTQTAKDAPPTGNTDGASADNVLNPVSADSAS